jgi:hypothetical protein
MDVAAPAVVAAIHDATGRVDPRPAASPERILPAMHEAGPDAASSA